MTRATHCAQLCLGHDVTCTLRAGTSTQAKEIVLLSVEKSLFHDSYHNLRTVTKTNLSGFH